MAIYCAGGSRATGPVPSVVSGYESIFGYNRGDLDYKLLHMLNYGNIISTSTPLVGGTANRWWNMQAPLDATGNNFYSQRFSFNLAVNPFPLAAYQKIYQDFFRWSQWESADPTSYNFDWYAGSGNVFGSGIGSAIPSSNAYWKRDNMFSLRYCNWNKDLFMGMLPNSQFGDVAVVDVSGETGLGLVQLGDSGLTVQNYGAINSDAGSDPSLYEIVNPSHSSM